MHPKTTAVLLVGYQNDYFGPCGVLREVVEESSQINHVVENTVDLLQQLPDSVLVIATPIHFTPDYQELVDPVGILKNIKDAGALQANTEGAEMISALLPYQDRIFNVHGKRGFNAFAHTRLHDVLSQRGITHVVIAGTITSICIDSTARYAHELGYKVGVLSDCTASRTPFEQEFYCDNIFPVYADVLDHRRLLDQLSVVSAA